jgi:type IV secretory pathway VirB9-like protein
MATAKTNTDTQEVKNLYDKEKYTVTLELTEEKQNDVNVIINGEVTQIKRGEEVEVSAAVYEVLKNSERMDALALKRRKALEDKE